MHILLIRIEEEATDLVRYIDDADLGQALSAILTEDVLHCVKEDLVSFTSGAGHKLS